MSSRLSTSQPVTIETELIPLVDNFWLEANGQTEQWYYDNTGEYAPDRSIIPLIITPYIKATDTDSHTSYTPNFYTVEWYVQQWNGTAWARTKVTNTTDTPANPFVIVGNTLKVNKNVESPQYGITIDCEATYIDPRDAGVTYPRRESITLTMNKDATVPYPKIQVLAESAQSFNPLKDSSTYDFKAEADWKGVSGDNGSLVFKADNLGTEEITTAKTDAPSSCAPILDIRYDKGNASVEQTDQKFTFRQTGGGLLPAISSGTGKIEKMKGNTVVWNQPITSPNFENVNGWNHVNASSLVASNNTMVFQTTSVAAIVYFTSNADVYLHKYYITYLIKIETTNASDFYTLSDIGTTYTENTIPASQKSNFNKVSNVTQHTDVRGYTRFGLTVEGGYNSGDYVYVKNFWVVDLTLMFGAGNEPSTVADFESWLDANVGLKEYYPYDAGSLIPVKDTTLKTVGFNLWDEQWNVGSLNDYGEQVTDGNSICSKNYTRVLPDTTYYLHCGSATSKYFIRPYYFDKNRNIIGIGAWSANNLFTTPSNTAYIKITTQAAAAARYGNTYLNDICINLSDATKNGTYEAHWENNLQIPITTLKGKVVTNGVAGGSDVVMFPDGIKSAYIAYVIYDEINLKTGRAVKRVGSVNLGSLDWSKNGETFFSSQIGTWKGGSNYYVCGKYTIEGCGTNPSVQYGLYRSEKRLYVKDPNYSTADAFKTAMNGVYLYYELATPIEYQFDPIPQGQFEWYGVSNGTEVKIETLPAYVSGQNTDTLRIDALYGEEITVICRYRKFPWDTELIPQKEYRMVAWRIPNIDTIVVCKNGSSVNSASTGSYTFETIVNVKGEMISDEVKAANLRFKWKMRKSNTTTETDLGWGLTKSIPVSDLKSTVVNGNPVSTIVYCEVYLLGAYEPVTTNGVTTYERTIDLS